MSNKSNKIVKLPRPIKKLPSKVSASRMRLTPKEIQDLSDLNREISGANSTIQVAMDHHRGVMGQLNQIQLQYWNDVINSRGLDPLVVYGVENVNGSPTLVPRPSQPTPQ